MTCYSPLKGYRSLEKNENGKYPIVFSSRNGDLDKRVDVPCGQCLGCRIDKTRQWAIRCMNEAECNKNNCFITLTYNDKNLPKDGSLNKRDFALFMKRFRKAHDGLKVKYFHCGEYGEDKKRPHHHAIIFGYDFRDDNRYKNHSIELESLWPLGNNFVGNVEYDSARYVASYIFEKKTGREALEHYPEVDVDETTGEVLFVMPEFCTMSRRPGIGKEWVDKYGKEVYNFDSVLNKGREVKPPKYYDKRLEKLDEEKYKKIKLMRRSKAKEWHPDDLERKEENARRRMSLKRREL